MTFDPDTFRRLSGAELYRYYEAVEKAGRVGVTPEALVELLGQIWGLHMDHANFLIIWGVDAGIPGVADAVIEFVRRYQDRGAQVTVIKALAHAKDLSQWHVASLEALRIQWPDNWMLARVVEELQQDWRARQHRP